MGCSCGAYLDEHGYCLTGGGYPIIYTCHFVCPFCRHSLSWDGGCTNCKGSHTPSDRLTWTFPGDRYEVQYGHWVQVEGPAKATSPENVKACMQVIDKVFLGLNVEEANKEIAGILGGPGEDDESVPF